MIATLFLMACGNNPKTFENIRLGMTKADVVTEVGEPSKKNDLLMAELWVYDQYDRTLVFKSDTVSDIITSAEARVDSIENSLKDFGQDVKQKLDHTGDTIDSASLRIKNKIMGEKSDN